LFKIKVKNMRKILSILMVSFALFGSSHAYAKKAGSNGGAHNVRGHVKKDGTYVQPHHATNPNKTQKDNWSSKPNVNPYTGKQGTKEPEH
jgi:hypothetical protein